jgi:hypothetical protein
VVGAACVVGARAAGDFFFIHLDETGSCTKITMMKVRLSGLDKLCEHQNKTVTHNSKAFSITGSCIICYWRCGLVGAPQALTNIYICIPIRNKEVSKVYNKSYFL